ESEVCGTGTSAGPRGHRHKSLKPSPILGSRHVLLRSALPRVRSATFLSSRPSPSVSPSRLSSPGRPPSARLGSSLSGPASDLRESKPRRRPEQGRFRLPRSAGRCVSLPFQASSVLAAASCSHRLPSCPPLTAHSLVAPSRQTKQAPREGAFLKRHFLLHREQI